MMPALAAVAGLLTIVCVVPYLRDTYRGVTSPQRTTWFVFAALSALSAAGQFDERAWGGFGLSVGATVGFGAVAALSVRRGRGGTSRSDVVALAIAAAGALVWLGTGEAAVAVVGVIVAEWAVGLLTIIKAAREPDSETLATWVIDAAAGVVAIGATSAELLELAYPVHHAVLNACVAGAILLGRRTSQTAQVVTA